MAYKPKTGEVAGCDIIGYRQIDGSIRLGRQNGTQLPDFPEEVIVEGVTYTLEDVKKNLPHNNIEWGLYV